METYAADVKKKKKGSRRKGRRPKRNGTREFKMVRRVERVDMIGWRPRG